MSFLTDDVVGKLWLLLVWRGQHVQVVENQGGLVPPAEGSSDTEEGQFLTTELPEGTETRVMSGFVCLLCFLWHHGVTLWCLSQAGDTFLEL